MALPDIVVRMLLGILMVALHVQFYPLCKLLGYKRFEPKPDSVLVTCCTNGLGHIHQMERVLGVLQAEGIKFPVIVLAKEQKVPEYKMRSLLEKFPNTEFVNLDFEVDYDNGKSFKNSAIAWRAFKSAATGSVRLTRTVVKLLRRHRPAFCLSFWEPAFATVMDVLNCPTKIVSLASQGQIYRDSTGVERGLFMRGLHQLNLGKRGTLMPLSVLPMEGAVPQIVKLPAPKEPEDFFVAYTTVPQVLSPIRTKFRGQKVLLFVKEKRLSYYTRKYQRYPHVEVRAASPDFPDYLARSRGLIASPSRGVVTQAIAAGKPVYLFCPRGHLEQEYNLRFYLKNFAGVACPRTRRYRRHLQVSRSCSLPDDWAGKLQTLQEWEASIKSLDLTDQRQRLASWLEQTDSRIRELLVPMLRSPPQEMDATDDDEDDDDEDDDEEDDDEDGDEGGDADGDKATVGSKDRAEQADEEEEEEDDDDNEDESPDGCVPESDGTPGGTASAAARATSDQRDVEDVADSASNHLESAACDTLAPP